MLGYLRLLLGALIYVSWAAALFRSQGYFQFVPLSLLCMTDLDHIESTKPNTDRALFF